MSVPWWSDLLRRVRRQRDVSQRELADLAGVPTSTIGDLEAGHVVPLLSTLDRALQAAGYRLDVVDAEDGLATWIVSGIEPRDRAGRRYPPHLDLRSRRPWPGTDELPWTFHLERWRRDVFRLSGRFGVWGCGPPAPAGFDAAYVREVWGDQRVDAFLRDAAWLQHPL